MAPLVRRVRLPGGPPDGSLNPSSEDSPKRTAPRSACISSMRMVYLPYRTRPVRGCVCKRRQSPQHASRGSFENVDENKDIAVEFRIDENPFEPRSLVLPHSSLRFISFCGIEYLLLSRCLPCCGVFVEPLHLRRGIYRASLHGLQYFAIPLEYQCLRAIPLLQSRDCKAMLFRTRKYKPGVDRPSNMVELRK